MTVPSDPSDPYASFAPLYDWLASDKVASGEHFWDRFRDSLTDLPPGAHILDCACGTGYNALALARHGFTVTGSDASEAMLAEARRRLPGRTRLIRCTWSELPETFAEPFDVVICTGNSLIHAGEERSMLDALAGMAGVLRPGGLLLLDTRNWEAMRRQRPLIQVPGPPVTRNEQAAVAVYTWHWPDRWDADHLVEIAVVGTDGQQTTVGRTQITFRPFRFTELADRIRRAGFDMVSHTYRPETDVYEVTARRSPSTDATG